MDSFAAKSAPPVIEMKNVEVPSWADQEQPVLTGVNWVVAPNDYWVVAGMHDSGKRDLISMLAGLTPPLQGEYRLFGREMPLYSEELVAQRLRLGIVFDSGHLLRHLNIRENIALPLLYHREFSTLEIEERLRNVLEFTELTPFADTMPGQLTTHWQKRASLARALALEPDLLLIDHPLGGLDLRHAHWWLHFLDDVANGEGFFKGRRTTLVVTTEDLRPWRNPACRFALLNDTRFVALGQRPELVAHPEPLVKELLAEMAD